MIFKEPLHEVSLPVDPARECERAFAIGAFGVVTRECLPPLPNSSQAKCIAHDRAKLHRKAGASRHHPRLYRAACVGTPGNLVKAHVLDGAVEAGTEGGDGTTAA